MHPDAHPTRSRREFLAAGSAAVAAMALAGRPAPAVAAEEGDYLPFKMGLQSYTLRHFDLADALAKTEALGLHYWESYSNHTPIDPAKADQLKAAAAARKVGVIGFGVSGFTKDHDANRKIFEFGKAMGVDYLSADPTPDAFDSLDKLTEEYSIRIGIHPHGPGSRWVKIDQIFEAIKDHSKRIGLCNDTGHLLRAGEDPVRAIEVFGDRTYGVHLKDVKGTDTFTILGEGDLKLAEFLKALAGIRYEYCLALEYEEHEADPIADIQKCLAAVRSALKKV